MASLRSDSKSTAPTLLFLLLLASSAWAAAPSATSAPAQIQEITQAVLPLALLTAVMIIALAVMGAEAFNLPGLNAWAKFELSELVVAVLLCVALLGMINEQFLALFIPAPTITDPSLGSFQNYLNNNLYVNNLVEYNREMFVILADSYFRLAKISGFTYDYTTSIGPISSWYSATPQIGLSALLTAVSKAMDTLTTSILVLASYKVLIQVAHDVVPTLLLPIALGLRVLAPTRKIGSGLIALCIGLYILLPASVSFTGMIYDQVRTSMAGMPLTGPNAYPNAFNYMRGGPNADSPRFLPIYDAPEPPGYGIICNDWIVAFTSLGEIGWSLIICPPLQPVVPYPVCKVWVTAWYIVTHATFSLIYSGDLRSYISNVPVDPIYETLYGTAMPIVSQLFILALPLPLLSLIITVTLTRSVSVALGGEGQFYGLAKII